MKIIFGLPDKEYHAIPAFSSSGCKEMLVSTFDFWWNSWMNPARKESSDSPAKLFGRAFHACLLEGQEAFESRYLANPDPKDYPDALKGADDMRAALELYGLKKSGSKGELRQRLIDSNRNVVFWDDLVEKLTAGKEVLPADSIQDITSRCRVVRANPSIKGSVEGGMSEVSVFWTESTEYGDVPMKCRLDYLNVKNGFILDVKTFQNSDRRRLDEAATRTIALYKYHLSSTLYMHALTKTIEAEDLVIEGDAPDGFIEDLKAMKKVRFVWLFVQNHGAPNALARECREFETYASMGATANIYFTAGQDGWKHAVKQFARFMDHYGPDKAWISPDKTRALTDEDLPVYVQNGII